jgi:hypothetical protein
VGVELLNAAPSHPQTLGKLERLHRTLKEWLSDEGPAADLAHLQLPLDRFCSHDNDERPHQGIGNLTPAERYLPPPGPAAPPGELEPAQAEEAPDYPPGEPLVARDSVVPDLAGEGVARLQAALL